MELVSGSYPYLPLWLLTLLLFAALILAREVGAFFQRRRRAAPGVAEQAQGAPIEEKEKEEDAFAMTTVMGLLALLIGFTFSLALQRYDSRRELVVKEANALGTTWLRIDLLAPEDQERMRDVLRRYVDQRVSFGEASRSGEELERYRQTEALQGELWSTMVSAIAPFRDTPRAGLMVSTTNESIDLAAERFATRQAHIPARILRLLLLFSLLAAGLIGYQRPDQRKVTTIVLLLFTLAVALVIDLDQPSSGMTNVPQQPMLDLQRSLRTGD